MRDRSDHSNSYHDWEHFSSIRNLRGPHAGLPNVVESPAPEDSDSPPSPISPIRKRPGASVRLVGSPKVKHKPESKRVRSLATHIQEAAPLPLTPSQVPLPMSRSPSPPAEEIISASPIPYPLPPSPPSPARLYRSPKRTFDESSASSEGSQQSKRVRGSKPPSGISRLNPDFDIETPSLTISTPGSPSSSLSELSSLSSRESTPPPPEEARQPSPLTKRQRKHLGLPKQRKAMDAGPKASVGKIIIPGGRFKRTGVAASRPVQHAGSEANEEWQRNGTGRLDVRGFRELKI